MWSYEHTVAADADRAAIWALYADVSEWLRWDTGLSAVTLDGPFAAGSTGTLAPAGQDPLPFTITEATPGVGFTDETPIPGAVLRFIHRLTPDGPRTTITHRLEIDGPATDTIGPNLGPAITADFPEAMARLAELAAAPATPARAGG